MKTVTRLDGSQAAYDDRLTDRDALINDYILSAYGASALHNPGIRAKVAGMVIETTHFHIIETDTDLIGIKKRN